MNDTSNGYECCRALLQLDEQELKQLMYASVMSSLVSGQPVAVSVRVTDGSYRFIEISTIISTDTASESGGPDKG